MAGRPPPHRVMRGFLGEALAARLLACAIDNEASFRPAGLGSGEEERVNPSVRLSAVLRDFGELKQEVRSRVAAAAPGLIDASGVPPFDVARIEIEMVAHGDGAFFKRHRDTVVGEARGPTDRLVSGVYYFQTEPRRYSGGALRLHDALAADGHHLDIVPEHDLLVVFPAWVPHEVLPVSCPSGGFADSRFALNCWLLRARSGQG